MAPPVYHYSPNSVVFMTFIPLCAAYLKIIAQASGYVNLFLRDSLIFFLRSTAYCAAQWKQATTWPGQKSDGYPGFQKEAFLFSTG